MPYWLIDGVIYCLYALKWMALFLASAMFLLGLDDLFIDIVYWGRRLKRASGIYRRNERADEERLFEKPEQPLAIMVPAWQEVGVVGEMARLLASTVDYENYQMFVGTYPNDPETQAEVDAVCQQYRNVHKVVCTRPGPTSKADCLNNVINAILSFEEAAGIEFAGLILHDAEDVISPMELRLFNYLLPRKDFIQIPVYPFPPGRWDFTAGHYLDEFAEYHSKDVVVREALTGQVPSAGVGTCFSRRAILTLLREGDGIAFDIQSLTEDYDIGYRLKEHGLEGIFVRYTVRDPKLSPFREKRLGVTPQVGGVICVREHFPLKFKAVVRQKARWITGIVFQGTQHLGWSRHWKTNYFLWRDRRGIIAYPIALLVNLLLIVMIGLWLTTLLLPDAWRFHSILEGPLLHWLLVLNGLLLANRLFQRLFFVTVFYGVVQGLLSIPRMMWSNAINFVANLRALKLFTSQRHSRQLTWEKTTHDFPSIDDPRRRPIGERLVERGIISSEVLDRVLLEPRQRRLGRELLNRNLIDSEQLAEVLAEQAGLEWSPLNPFALPPEVIEKLPRRLALRYSALPMEEQGDTLVLACENAISPVSLGAISRQLKRPVIARIVPQGRVTLGLRYWYLTPAQAADTHRLKECLARHPQPRALLESFCRHQLLLGDMILERGWVPPTLMTQALMDFDPTRESLGNHLLARRMLTSEALEQALLEQRREQQRAMALLEEAPA
ncbi:adsorption protein B [Modicisalibacter ilicicola DSM 19980]|uniref:Adsorption protein B n=1 Tax=Modicisalibacter ilicicola DSM 19980 TaxID=1121942 RepID=A0A1M5DV19_9GAMM|nr:glycosyl transferase family protein [Halomonas ilicicola]SHF70785.1 adsorption protein B [Halomonas ilicicola DSM 19980]